MKKLPADLPVGRQCRKKEGNLYAMEHLSRRLTERSVVTQNKNHPRPFSPAEFWCDRISRTPRDVSRIP